MSRAGVFCFAESHARSATVFWCPRRCVHVLPVVADQPSALPTGSLFDLAALSCRATVLLRPDESQHVHLRNAEHSLQLTVSGADILRPVCLRAEAIWPAALLKHRLWGLECLNALCLDGQLPARLFTPERRGTRLTFVLRALDGSLAGASHREIAEALIGEGRVHSDWNDPGDHLRDRIRRAVARGRALMNGGYLDFLV
ncbi:MAG: DUF2285 domain-containing protein [Mesorhizobium sp.]|nr:MAG: DUF2285 domain-containing protein [Mesorhizobium sp.]